MTDTGAVTLGAVAQQAGVSLSTASRALNDAYGVSARTRKRVLDAAAALDFTAFPDASRLARDVTGRVALVVPHIDRWFFGQMVGGIERVLSNAAVDVLLYHVDDAADRRKILQTLPARRRVDALVVVGFPVNDEDRPLLELIGAKVVTAGGRSPDYPYVCIDDRAAGTLAVEHLTTLGHERIAMIAGHDQDEPGWPSVSGRSRAYHEVLSRAGIAPDPELLRDVPWSAVRAAQATADILDTVADPPTAIYAHSDELAFGVLSELARRGLRTPDDVSVISIDDHPLAEVTGLTTVAQDVRTQGRIAGELVLASIAGKDSEPPAGVITPVHLIERSSTAPGIHPLLIDPGRTRP
jgi:DNA-binding LacI/PurR family transcriptional regulator